MEPRTLIVAHENLDFDALASMVAAQKLYPGAVIGLGRRLSASVREFWSLHKERFRAEHLDRLDLGAVERLVVVDVRDAKRLVHVAPVLERVRAGAPIEVVVFDHHPASGDDLVSHVEVVEPVGAATTLLVERIRARGLEIDRVEATLFALGIYMDTGALTFARTTPRDAEAVAWLLDRGASLAMINRYLEVTFSEAQRAVLADVLAHPRVERVGGLSVGLATVHVEARVEGLAELTSEACRLLALDALFLIAAVRAKAKVDVVGRSRSGLVDVGAAMRAVGGGGHAGAGAATVRTGDLEALRATLLASLEAARKERPTVGDVMSSPVRTVRPDLSLRELGERLDAWSHGGVPVVRDGRLVGVVSRRDVERARAGSGVHLPVASHMSAELETTTLETPLEDALAHMVRADVGRLPVLREGKLIGIVSRSDLLRVLYPDSR